MQTRGFDYSKEKDQILQEERGVSFSDVVQSITEGRLLGDIEHHNQEKYPNQRILIVEIKNYVYAVPYVEDPKSKKAFLKTVYPSRKYNEKYLGNHE